MENQELTKSKLQDSTLLVKMILTAWDAQFSKIDKLFKSFSYEQLMNEVAPGRNRGIYLLGHQTAVTDGMLPLLEFGDKLFPELQEVFIKNSDKSGLEMPSIEELKQKWDAVNKKLADHIEKMSTEEWFEKHTAVSDEEFQHEPHRNKLNIIISRTNHQAYHIGQLVFLEKKAE
ncbi:MAG TPA: DinB family protein [Saprospiraceae bacterium]|nr:DinB family protein [Saprospiraceae bacterium]